jgi:hypothetical protein
VRSSPRIQYLISFAVRQQVQRFALSVSYASPTSRITYMFSMVENWYQIPQNWVHSRVQLVQNNDIENIRIRKSSLDIIRILYKFPQSFLDFWKCAETAKDDVFPGLIPFHVESCVYPAWTSCIQVILWSRTTNIGLAVSSGHQNNVLAQKVEPWVLLQLEESFSNFESLVPCVLWLVSRVPKELTVPWTLSLRKTVGTW